MGNEDIIDIQESIAFKTNIDKGSFHPREDVLHPPFINIAHNFLVMFPFYIKLYETLVLPDCNPGFPRLTLTIISLYIFSAPIDNNPRLLHWRTQSPSPGNE